MNTDLQEDHKQLRISSGSAALISFASAAATFVMIYISDAIRGSVSRLTWLFIVLLWLSGATFGLIASRSEKRAIRVVGIAEFVVSVTYLLVLVFIATAAE